MAVRILVSSFALLVVPTLQDSTAAPAAQVQQPAMMMIPQTAMMAPVQATTTTPAPTTTKTTTIPTTSTTTTGIPSSHVPGLASSTVDFYNTSFFRMEEVNSVLSGSWAAVPDLVNQNWAADWAPLMENLGCDHYDGEEFKALQPACKKLNKHAMHLKTAGFVLGRVSGHCQSSNEHQDLPWMTEACGAHGGGFCGQIDDMLTKIMKAEHAGEKHVHEIYFFANHNGWITSVPQSKADAEHKKLSKLFLKAGAGEEFLKTKHVAFVAGHPAQLTELLEGRAEYYQGLTHMKAILSDRYAADCVDTEQKWQAGVQGATFDMQIRSVKPAGLLAAVAAFASGCAALLLVLRARRHTLTSASETAELLEPQSAP